MRRTKEDAAETREKILDCAIRVISRKGYSATTLDDIAREAEVTRGAIYWHFKNKVDLFNTLLVERFTGAYQGMDERVKDKKQLYDMLYSRLISTLTALKTSDMFRNIQTIVYFKTELNEELEQFKQYQIKLRRRYIEEYTRIMQQAQQDGALAPSLDARRLAVCFVALVIGLMNIWLLDPAAYSLEKDAEKMVAAFLQNLIPE